jgi:hypothetical protein
MSAGHAAAVKSGIAIGLRMGPAAGIAALDSLLAFADTQQRLSIIRACIRFAFELGNSATIEDWIGQYASAGRAPQVRERAKAALTTDSVDAETRGTSDFVVACAHLAKAYLATRPRQILRLVQIHANRFTSPTALYLLGYIEAKLHNIAAAQASFHSAATAARSIATRPVGTEVEGTPFRLAPLRLPGLLANSMIADYADYHVAVLAQSATLSPNGAAAFTLIGNSAIEITARARLLPTLFGATSRFHRASGVQLLVALLSSRDDLTRGRALHTLLIWLDARATQLTPIEWDRAFGALERVAHTGRRAALVAAFHAARSTASYVQAAAPEGGISAAATDIATSVRASTDAILAQLTLGPSSIQHGSAQQYCPLRAAFDVGRAMLAATPEPAARALSRLADALDATASGHGAVPLPGAGSPLAHSSGRAVAAALHVYCTGTPVEAWNARAVERMVQVALHNPACIQASSAQYTDLLGAAFPHGFRLDLARLAAKQGAISPSLVQGVFVEVAQAQWHGGDSDGAARTVAQMRALAPHWGSGIAQLPAEQ